MTPHCGEGVWGDSGGDSDQDPHTRQHIGKRILSQEDHRGVKTMQFEFSQPGAVKAGWFQHLASSDSPASSTAGEAKSDLA